MADITYLHISGDLSENMVYRPRPGYESSRPRRERPAESDFRVILLDNQDRVLVSALPGVSRNGCGASSDPTTFRIRAALPLHPDGVAWELRRGDIRLFRTEVPAEPPRMSAIQVKKTTGGLTLAWKRHLASKITFAVVAKMDSGKQITLIRGLKDPAFEIEWHKVPAEGKGRLFVVANDGVRSGEIEVETFVLEPRPPSVHILSPRDSARLPYGQPISVAGVCFDATGSPCPAEHFSWLLDQRPIAEGTPIAVIENPAAGKHELTLSYPWKDQRIETSAAYTVEEPDEHHRHWLDVMRNAFPDASRP